MGVRWGVGRGPCDERREPVDRCLATRFGPVDGHVVEDGVPGVVDAEEEQAQGDSSDAEARQAE